VRPNALGGSRDLASSNQGSRSPLGDVARLPPSQRASPPQERSLAASPSQAARRRITMRALLPLTTMFIGSLAFPTHGQGLDARVQESRFEMTEAFIRNEWRHPVRNLDVTILGAGPVHAAVDDCEIHVGAELADQSISDFPDIVLEPPSVCKDRSKSRQAW